MEEIDYFSQKTKALRYLFPSITEENAILDETISNLICNLTVCLEFQAAVRNCDFLSHNNALLLKKKNFKCILRHRNLSCFE